jgi:hypothetical protein
MHAMRWSRLVGTLRIGPTWLDRYRTDREVHGIVDRIADWSNPGIDVTKVHPAVVAFFERTDSLDLHIETRWRFPASTLWRLGRPIMRWLGQLVLPVTSADIDTRVFGLDPEVEGRPDARAVIRTYRETGDVMQTVSYGTREEGGAGYMSAAFPLAFGHLAGVLRLDPHRGDGALLTSVRRGDHTGVWFVLFGLPIRTPFGERFYLWPGDERDALVCGRHEQYFFGVRLVTHRYWFFDRALRPRS